MSTKPGQLHSSPEVFLGDSVAPDRPSLHGARHSVAGLRPRTRQSSDQRMTTDSEKRGLTTRSRRILTTANKSRRRAGAGDASPARVCCSGRLAGHPVSAPEAIPRAGAAPAHPRPRLEPGGVRYNHIRPHMRLEGRVPADACSRTLPRSDRDTANFCEWEECSRASTSADTDLRLAELSAAPKGSARSRCIRAGDSCCGAMKPASNPAAGSPDQGPPRRDPTDAVRNRSENAAGEPSDSRGQDNTYARRREACTAPSRSKKLRVSA